ncbi:aldehyde dehydrogenase family protein [Auraticoccus monumenti]|uniref:Succinate-semialdehyde dehydrogenase / glutarate-semialdehyde dehydrogenase n=1 Tax=Auraticoccus monumenti TaxID=675864 RepID=A0A1G7ALN2_9ACTN|nr:aldehyde dehydrogenase family protein [Auraticoccus monumenti]SDE15778.1 succinate-semialdehyde dehydrogenase / glutarate-semialdehyde dehydrogenase [Auraticoccus monumenti]
MSPTVPAPLNLVGGSWVQAGEPVVDVVDPATGEVVTRIPDTDGAGVDAAVAAAREALADWRTTTPFHRATLLHRLADGVREHRDELVGLVTLEMGKPLREAGNEVDKLADAFDYYAEEAVRVHGETIPNEQHGVTSIVRYEPVGVVGAITPWNYPLELIGWKLAAALAAGCTIVVKPSEYTPSSAVALMALLQPAGFPDGVANLVLGAGVAGRALASHPGLDKLAFTGSTATGAAISRSVAKAMPLSMELGGSCPQVVTASADVDEAVAGCLRRGFRNAGQICIAINRVYVHRSVHREFVEKLTAGVEALTVGPGSKDPDVGPVTNAGIRDRCVAHVQQAVADGARVTTGGAVIDRPGTWFAPTVVDEVPPTTLLAQEETFGPVVGVTPYDTTEEAVALANGTTAGLAAYLYARDLTEVFEIGHALDFGNVAVNNPDAGIMNAPYGGRKGSGHGYEHGREGLFGYLHIKHLRVRYGR